MRSHSDFQTRAAASFALQRLVLFELLLGVFSHQAAIISDRAVPNGGGGSEGGAPGEAGGVALRRPAPAVVP